MRNNNNKESKSNNYGFMFFGTRNGLEVFFKTPKVAEILGIQNKSDIEKYLYTYLQLNIEKIPLRSPKQRVLSIATFKAWDNNVISYSIFDHAKDHHFRHSYFATSLLVQNASLISDKVIDLLFKTHERNYRVSVDINNTYKINDHLDDFLLTSLPPVPTGLAKYRLLSQSQIHKGNTILLLENFQVKTLNTFFSIPYLFDILDSYNCIYGTEDENLFRATAQMDKHRLINKRIQLIHKENFQKHTNIEEKYSQKTIAPPVKKSKGTSEDVINNNLKQILYTLIEENQQDHKPFN